MTTKHILRNLFFLKFLNKFYEVIIKRKLKYSMGTSNFMGPSPVGHYIYFLYRANTSGVKSRLIKKRREWEKLIL